MGSYNPKVSIAIADIQGVWIWVAVSAVGSGEPAMKLLRILYFGLCTLNPELLHNKPQFAMGPCTRHPGFLPYTVSPNRHQRSKPKGRPGKTSERSRSASRDAFSTWLGCEGNLGLRGSGAQGLRGSGALGLGLGLGCRV